MERVQEKEKARTKRKGKGGDRKKGGEGVKEIQSGGEGGDLIGSQPSGNVHGLKIGECVM